MGKWLAHSKHNKGVNYYYILLYQGKITAVTTSEGWYKNKNYMK